MLRFNFNCTVAVSKDEDIALIEMLDYTSKYWYLKYCSAAAYNDLIPMKYDMAVDYYTELSYIDTSDTNSRYWHMKYSYITAGFSFPYLPYCINIDWSKRTFQTTIFDSKFNGILCKMVPSYTLSDTEPLPNLKSLCRKYSCRFIIRFFTNAQTSNEFIY